MSTESPERMLRKEAVAAEEPAWWLLGPYDTAIAVPSLPAPVTVRAGRFSLGALNALRIFVTDTPTIITVGSFCEFGQSSLVIVGGNHRNESLLNFTFGDYGLKFFSALPDTDKPIVLTKNDGSPTYIGDNVMVSDRAIIIGGNSIGYGSVIGAGAVVASDCKPLGIYAGVPARLIKYRYADRRMRELYDAIRLPDVRAHHLFELPRLLQKLERDEITLADYLGGITFLKRRPIVHLSAALDMQTSRLKPASVVGYALDDELITDRAILAQLNRYFLQIGNYPYGEVEWYPDIFAALGLV